MKFEYIIFNLVILAGPLALSFDQKVRFYLKWKPAFISIFSVAAVYLIWDIVVTGRHWWFNPTYTSEFTLLNLPPGEWLFFITVPYACLFIWEVFNHYFPGEITSARPLVLILLASSLPLGIFLFLSGPEYSGLSIISLSMVGIIGLLLRKNIFSKRHAPLFFGLVFLLILIFNSYLTARPVVLYSDAYRSGLQILTIPVEDFGYGISLVFLCVILFEKLKGARNG